MKKIIYYVATSLDGFISGPNNDVSNFVGEGNGVEKYLSDLKQFSTVMMGRKTYEFGYLYGLTPGQPAYPHMEHYIFSDSLHLENAHDLLHIETLNIERIQEIKEQSPTDVYLCGGGEFAGWLLDHGQIDILKLKINPIILGGGVKLFGDSKTNVNMNLQESQVYDNGLQIVTYELIK
ncbi:dihydrofolate reductase family protein [uncultured Dokdonia sp.]|uniref:dihydrofolate reductase family protein n=1 Tax=uncultured Dokdonia sp. TaxID=575653 RepID=UPI002607B00B|nr:dihydrofolate reductase family protein [uncultured Dokdonia sp.]